MPSVHHLRRLQTLKVGRDLEVKPLAVRLDQGDMHGWIHINLTVDGLTRTIWATAVAPPFDDIVEFLKDVLVGTFPAECVIEEERYATWFTALEHPDPNLFRFQLSGAGYNEIYMDNVFVRSQFALAFYMALKMFERHYFDPELWGESWMFNASTEPLRILIEQTFPEENI